MAEFTISVLQLAIPTAIETIKASCKVINNELEKRKNSQNLEDELPNALERLSSKVYIFEGFMQAAPDRQDQGPGVQQWFDKMKDTLYDAEDLLDGYATDMAVQEMEEADKKTKRRFIPEVRASISTHKNIYFSKKKNAKFANQIKSIIVRLEELEKTRAGLGIKVVSDPKQNKMKLKWRETDHILDNCPIMGRDDESREIKQVLQIDDGSYLSNKNSKQITTKLASSMKFLFDTTKNILAQLGITNNSNNNNRDQQPKLSVLPIIGMGGIGKTTLAKLLYNDPVVASSFDLKVWVCVSDNFDERIIIKNTIRRIDSSQEIKESDTKAYIKSILSESVKGKSMFLVLDDIWNAEIGAWNSLLGTFGEACKLSRGITIIITTRLTDIRTAIPTCMEPVLLKGLEDEDIWEVVKFHAFRNYGKSPGYDNRETLETFGKRIVVKLKGSPLAAKTIGKLLDSSHTAKHWRDIACKEFHTLKQKEDDIIPILRLSYEYLPIHLKQCLIYFSLFPKDYEFRKMEMVRYWIAHNCIQHADDEDVEDVAIQYFELLVNRSFLECDDYDSYLMHDLIHDVVQSVSKFDCYWLYDDGSEKGFGNSKGVQRHASIHRNGNLDYLYEKVLPSEKLRTFISTRYWNSKFISHMRCLRVLKLHNFKVDDCIGACKHLRVLVIEYVTMSPVPKFLGQLYNLQVLQLYDCKGMKRLPQTMTRLVNLRYVEINDWNVSLLKLPGFGRLSSLRAWGSNGVSRYSVVRKKGLGIDELKHLNMLQGSLRLGNLQLLTSKEEALQACLDKKSRLRELEFKWETVEITTVEETQQQRVVEGLKPCKQLRIIKLESYMGGQLPTWMSDIWLEVLEEINLDRCYEIKTVPPCLGKMPALKKLRMDGLYCLKEIKWHREDLLCGDENIILFPALSELYLCDLQECVGWWIVEEAGPRQENKIQTTNKNFPHLTELSITYCPKLKCFPVLTDKVTVTEAGPPPATLAPSSLRKLKIDGLDGMDDEWLSDFLFKCLTSLETLDIGDCPKLTSFLHIPEKMTSLRKMTIDGCENLISCCCPPSLTSLEISGCAGMTSLCIGSRGLLSLQHFELRECPSLSSLPDLRPLPALRLLEIDTCPNLKDMHKDVAPPPAETHPSSLQTLNIYGLDSMDDELLSDFLFKGLTSLEELYIHDCPKLTSFLHIPEKMTSLRKMTINGCENLISCCCPPSLTSLLISNCDRITLLCIGSPDSSVGSLIICNCPNLGKEHNNTSACIERLCIEKGSKEQLAGLLSHAIHPAKLKTLDIHDCPMLSSLPDLRPLTALRRLHILDCPMLKDRYEKREDYEICHIPDVEFDRW